MHHSNNTKQSPWPLLSHPWEKLLEKLRRYALTKGKQERKKREKERKERKREKKKEKRKKQREKEREKKR